MSKYTNNIKVIYLLKLKYYNINSRINEQNTCKFNNISVNFTEKIYFHSLIINYINITFFIF